MTNFSQTILINQIVCNKYMQEVDPIQQPQVAQSLPSSKIIRNILSSVVPHRRMLVHFKNSLHDGYFSPDTMRREGPGISVLDNGCLVVGNYKNDQNMGPTLIFLSADTYFMGEFNKGALDGPFVIRSPRHVTYSCFVNNKIEGQMVTIDYERWIAQLWAIERDGSGQISKQIGLAEILNSYLSYEQIKRVQNKITSKLDKTKYIRYEQQILKKIAPYVQAQPPVSELLSSMKSGTNEFANLGHNLFSHKIYQNNQLVMLNGTIGNMNSGGTGPQFVGFALNKKQQIIAYGQFKQVEFFQSKKSQISASREFQNYYHINGIGLYVQQSPGRATVTYCGEFQHNKLHGQGYKHVQGEKIIYGKFTDGNIRNVDVGQASEEKDEQILKLMLKKLKNIHIHSLKFYNNYANQRPIYILNNLHEMVGDAQL